MSSSRSKRHLPLPLQDDADDVRLLYDANGSSRSNSNGDEDEDSYGVLSESEWDSDDGLLDAGAPGGGQYVADSTTGLAVAATFHRMKVRHGGRSMWREGRSGRGVRCAPACMCLSGAVVQCPRPCALSAGWQPATLTHAGGLGSAFAVRLSRRSRGR